jgi:Mrp family chromosome partitioning ATPase
MSALDKAIIKAYRPARRIDAPAVETVAAAPRVVSAPAVPLSRALAGLSSAESSGAATSTPTVERVSTSIGAMLDEALQSEPHDDIDSQAAVVAAPPAATRKTPAAPGKPSPTAPSVQLPPPPAQNVTIGSATAENTWSPLLQVDRVVWPTIHNRLQGAAKAAIALMTDGLQSIGDSGRKIIGLASAARGEGVTTLLSAAARNLLERGRTVAVVDSHWENPQLAKSLGLLPQIGWEEALLGGLPLEEIVIESLADGLAVLPVREPPASAIAKTAIGQSLETLADKFDFVLVDLGPLSEIADKSTPAHEVAARMDAVVLVQNVRVTPPSRLAEVQRRLAESKMRYAGTIQNFVAG